MSYTKGPWLFDCGDIGEDSEIRYATIYTQDDTIIAEFNDRLRESKDNARLIAAAPDLLEALEFARMSLETMPEKGLQYLPGNTLPMIRAVIAKAKGDA